MCHTFKATVFAPDVTLTASTMYGCLVAEQPQAMAVTGCQGNRHSAGVCRLVREKWFDTASQTNASLMARRNLLATA